MVAVALLLALFLPARASDIPQQLRVCGDANEWPPYSYFKRIGSKASAQVTGFNVDLVNTILDQSGRKANYQLLPWKRCLSEAAAGSFDVVLDGMPTPERSQQFHFSSVVYQTDTIYFYRRDAIAPQLKSIADLQRYRVCGQHGYAYLLADGQPMPNISTDVKSYSSLIKALELGQCDIVPLNRQIAEGYRDIGLYNAFANDRLATQAAPAGANARVNFHLMVSRQPAYSEALNRLLDDGIRKAIASGEAVRILARHQSQPALP